MKKNLKIILVSVAIIILIVSGILLYNHFFNKDKDILTVTSATVFGQKVNLIKEQHIYEVFLKNGEIKDISGGCEFPFAITTNHDYGTSSIYYSDDLKEATIQIGLRSGSIKSNWQQSFSYEFSVYFDNPIKVSDKCNPSKDIINNEHID